MSNISDIFERIKRLTREEGHNDLVALLLNHQPIEQNHDNSEYKILVQFLQKCFTEVDELASEIKKDDTILISVSNQKLLRTCFQLVTSLGFSLSLIPGVGISLSKRCSTSAVLPPVSLTDEQKYDILVACTDFFTRCYEVPVLKSIIVSFHMSDYLAALIQLSFAPLKKPGVYANFTMTQDMYDRLSSDRKIFIQTYEKLVTNCFQPILMKELLVLQSVTDPIPPMFVKRVIAKEMSRRLLASGGLLSLIRCFIESYNIDTGFEWKKIELICKIIATKHGNDSEELYLKNICSQLTQILTLNNTHYLATAVACVLALRGKYSDSELVKSLVKDIFQALHYQNLLSKSNLPGTIILSPQEVEHTVNVLHACVCTTKLEYPITMVTPNLYFLFILGMKCSKNEEMKIKLRDILIKCLEQLKADEVLEIMKKFFFGDVNANKIGVEEFEAGLVIKCLGENADHSTSDSVLYFLNLFKFSSGQQFVQNSFAAALQILIVLSDKRKSKSKDTFSVQEDVPFKEIDEQYANILQLLSEISISPKVIIALKENPLIVTDFIEYFIINSQTNINDECVTVALVLLNTILSNSDKTTSLENRLCNLIPVLQKMVHNESDFNHILCEEALSLLSSKKPKESESAYGKAVTNVFDDLLPVRAHGIMELTKLIEQKDAETLSKKHYIFCLLQEQLKDVDSYIYLSAINGISSLGQHCTEDVLQVLCKEFLQISSEQKSLSTNDEQNKTAELRMKIGDIIVKVTKGLGEMAIVHKTILLNTILCGCRDEDPLIRTSALSNLAEIARVLHYRIGTIIYEVLLCVWSIIETDKAIECRRAAVMVITSLLKGLGKDTLIQLKENLLPIYRTLKNLYKDPDEDPVVKLHAQLALEELNDIVNQSLFPEVKIQKQIFVLDKPEEMFK